MGVTRLCLSASLLVLVLIGPEPEARGAAQSEPGAFVKALGDESIALLEDREAPYEERRRRFRDLLVRGFDVDTISRFVLGRHWRVASPDQQAEYRRLFLEFIVETYVDRFDDYRGETFEILQVLPVDQRDSLVRTHIRSPDEPPIRVDYRVRNGADGPRILDVLIEGISMITTQRAEFGSVIAREGVDGLLALLRQKIEEASMSGSLVPERASEFPPKQRIGEPTDSGS